MPKFCEVPLELKLARRDDPPITCRKSFVVPKESVTGIVDVNQNDPIVMVPTSFGLLRKIIWLL